MWKKNLKRFQKAFLDIDYYGLAWVEEIKITIKIKMKMKNRNSSNIGYAKMALFLHQVDYTCKTLAGIPKWHHFNIFVSDVSNFVWLIFFCVNGWLNVFEGGGTLNAVSCDLIDSKRQAQQGGAYEYAGTH